MRFSILDVGRHRIRFVVGENPGGYSAVGVEGIQHGSISIGRRNQYGHHEKVWVFEYDPLPWEGIPIKM